MLRNCQKLIAIYVLVTSILLCISASSHAKTLLKIVATTSVLGDAIRNIVGDKAQVICLMGPGVDPHAYKATARNIQDLMKADIIFYNGLHLEGKLADILAKFSKQKPVYAASDGIESGQYLGDLQAADGIDPHIWFDISLWRQAVQYISRQLQLIDLSAVSYYQENTKNYLQTLDDLHEEVKKMIQSIPKMQRVLITAHDAFSYFGRAYDIEVKGLQGISTVEECGLLDIINLTDFMVHRRIKAIFPEHSVPSRPLLAVVEGCRKKGHQVILGVELYSDALGTAGTPEGTYIGMIETNVKTIVDALK